LPDFIDGADVGMVESGSGAGFCLKTFQGQGISFKFSGKEFEGNVTPKVQVFSLIDDTHATAAELLEDAVVRDGLADHEDGDSVRKL